MITILKDTLKDGGKWSIKRISGFSSFYIATIYAFVPVCYPSFIIHEFVFWGFITYAGTALGMTVWNKKIDKADL